MRQPRVSAMVVLLNKNKILLVRQYRYGANETLWEIPAGTVDPGESPLHCARRECEEETGYRPRSMKPLGSFVSAPAECDQKVYLYLAKHLVHTGMKPDPDEDIFVKAFTLAQVKRMLKTGLIHDAKSMVGLYRFFEKH